MSMFLSSFQGEPMRVQAQTACALFDDPVSQVSRRSGVEHLDGFELDRCFAQMLEHARAAAQHHWYEVDRNLVDQACADVLLPNIGAAHHADIFAIGSRLRSLESLLDAVGHEGIHASRWRIL